MGMTTKHVETATLCPMAPEVNGVTIFANLVSAVPWEVLSHDTAGLPAAAPRTAPPTPSPAVSSSTVDAQQDLPEDSDPEPKPEPEIIRPGCMAADESLTVLGHLQGLAAGWEGFGVLKTSKERLDKAVIGAAAMGDAATAKELSDFAETLPNVHTPDEAKAAAQALVPIAQKTWKLGVVCGRRHQSK
tara:strand:- start:1730 stop:2293 length:564 start_codon:yes stop_codon:yes gene_type:complete